VTRYVVLAIGVVAAVGCIRLGIWQLDRLDQRKERNAAIAQSLARNPIDLTSDRTSVLIGADSLHFRRAVARGTFDFQRQVLVMARVHRGVPGAYVVTPFLVAEDTAVLVERGWAPAPDGRAVELDSLREPESGLVEGVFLPPPEAPRATANAESSWPLYVRELRPAQLARSYDYDILPLALRRTGGGEELPPALRAVSLPQLTNGPHLSYALQWFSFATIAVIGSIVLYVRLGAERSTMGQQR